MDSHLKVFGCKAFVHVPKEQRSKLDSKSTPCIFIGYGDAKFGYKLWDPKEKKIIRSQDVVFHENENLADFEKTGQTLRKLRSLKLQLEVFLILHLSLLP